MQIATIISAETSKIFISLLWLIPHADSAHKSSGLSLTKTCWFTIRWITNCSLSL